MWIKKEEYERLQRQVADSNVERYYYKEGVDNCTTCSFKRGFPETVGAYPCIVCDNLIEYGMFTDNPWVRCRKRPEGRKIEEKKQDSVWMKRYYEGHEKWNKECLNLKNRIKELEAQLAKNKSIFKHNEGVLSRRIEFLESQLVEKEDSKLPFVVIHCTSESEKEHEKKSTEWCLENIEKEALCKLNKLFIDVFTHATPTQLKEQPKEKEVEVNPYYFESISTIYCNVLECTEICDKINDGIRIGCRVCRECKNCVEQGGDFIKCKLKPEGKAKKETERFKRDEYGVISESETPCTCCIYYKLPATKECLHCTLNNKDTEYYSSK